MHEIDAKGKKLGRVASEAASILMGKHRTDFQRNRALDVDVEVKNVSKMDLPQKKRSSVTYTRYSGYPSGLKKESMEDVISRHGYKEVLRRAVYGMLPANKLRARRIKHLKITE